jgi:hypothetical protein
MEIHDPSSRLVIREYPFFLWLFGLAFIVPGIWIISRPDGMLTGVILLVVGVLFGLVLAAVRTITIDRGRMTLTAQHRNLVRNKVREVNLGEVANVVVETSRSHTRSHSGSRSTTYRIVVLKTDGTTLPLQEEYSSGYSSKARKAKQMCQFLGLPGWEDKPTNIFQAAIQMQAAVSAAQEAPAQTGNTSGVAWSISKRGMGGQTVTRWTSLQFSWPDRFLLLMQKPRGSAPVIGGGGMLGGLSQMIYQQMLTMYGISAAETPGLQQASGLGRPEPELDPDYAVLTSSPGDAGSLLTAWVIHPLRNWADQHPMRTIQASGQPGQLVVLFSPQGLTAAILGTLSQQQTDELVYLGVDLVKAVGGTSSKKPGESASPW